jgi:tRNA threonylcarbamoyladenosine biosynthesis protein TsaE
MQNNMSQEFEVENLEELEAVAEAVLSHFATDRVFAFFGEMGAGKTTFIKVFCRHLGVTDNVSSPTYSLVNEYLDAKGDSVYHFDFYRIKDSAEAFDIGFDDYLYSNAYCFIEWPQRVENLLPESYVRITILEKAADPVGGERNTRTIKAESC